MHVESLWTQTPHISPHPVEAPHVQEEAGGKLRGSNTQGSEGSREAHTPIGGRVQPDAILCHRLHLRTVQVDDAVHHVCGAELQGVPRV